MQIFFNYKILLNGTTDSYDFLTYHFVDNYLKKNSLEKPIYDDRSTYIQKTILQYSINVNDIP